MSDEMPLTRYQIQLETPGATFSYEVVTGDSDGVGLARGHLARILSPAEAQAAHLGGYAEIGTGDAPEVTLVRRTP